MKILARYTIGTFTSLIGQMGESRFLVRLSKAGRKKATAAIPGPSRITPLMQAFEQGPGVAIELLKRRPFDYSRMPVSYQVWNAPHAPEDVFEQDSQGRTLLHFWATRTVDDLQKAGEGRSPEDAWDARKHSMAFAMEALNRLYLESVRGFLVADNKGQTPWAILLAGAPHVLTELRRIGIFRDPTPEMLSDVLTVHLDQGDFMGFAENYDAIWNSMKFGPKAQNFLQHLIDKLQTHPRIVAPDRSERGIFPRIFVGDWRYQDNQGVTALEHLARAPDHPSLAFLVHLAEGFQFSADFENFRMARRLEMHAEAQDALTGSPAPANRPRL
jgi:hypothetical protein